MFKFDFDIDDLEADTQLEVDQKAQADRVNEEKPALQASFTEISLSDLVGLINKTSRIPHSFV